jgi:hypothetical protein
MRSILATDVPPNFITRRAMIARLQSRTACEKERATFSPLAAP